MVIKTVIVETTITVSKTATPTDTATGRSITRTGITRTVDETVMTIMVELSHDLIATEIVTIQDNTTTAVTETPAPTTTVKVTITDPTT